VNTKELLEKQAEQQELLHGQCPEDPEARRVLGLSLASCLVGEVHEYLDTCGYGHLFPRESLPRTTRIAELVDILKYTLALCWLENIDHQELDDLFEQVTMVVGERFLPKDLSGKRLAVFDIDGVLTTNTAFRHDWAHRDKKAFFESNAAKNQDVADGASDFLQELYHAGWGIVLLSARPIKTHKRLEWETYTWLRHWNLFYHKVIFTDDKVTALGELDLPVDFVVEDDPAQALMLARAGRTVYLISNGLVAHPNIIPARDLRDVWRIVKTVC